ncbi:hypothetical protein EUTSA_v10019744mg [Eutrema salsugineum]|uniref:Uncharacterized protein n=1 Tax=Eutrema salsugineum TaxID=72664 RepID=V4KC80_EUTSA|nr:hypothetical protein EUTSA_v10019744mg [Eutrema salsugineum]
MGMAKKRREDASFPNRYFSSFLLIIRNQYILQYEHRIVAGIVKYFISRTRQVSDSSPTIFRFIILIKVMPIECWSFISKMIANKKYTKEGHNKFYLLAYKTFERKVWLLFTPSSKLSQFPLFTKKKEVYYIT